MPAIVMECISKKKHPNADKLFLYEFGDGTETLPVIANQENIYEAGKNAIIALEYSTLKDGTKIRVSSLRGVRSYGMALGHSELPIGTDVSDQYCENENQVNGFTFKAWPDIGQLFNVRKDMSDNDSLREVVYRPKIKLDGTNASIRIAADGRIAAQSRSRLLTVDDDNYGFAAWVDANQKHFSAFGKDIIIHGEWCGQGIGGGAIRQVEQKLFAVFAVLLEKRDGDTIVYEPELIKNYIDEKDDIYILPWAGDILTLSYHDKPSLRQQASALETSVSELDICDPWVKERFGKEGTGEGFVMYPIPDDTGMMNRYDFSELLFKAKTEKHRVVKTKKAVEVDPAVAKSIDEFVELFATDARFEQMKKLVGDDLHQKYTGEFVRRFTIDVKKESTAELEASGLEWKQVGKAVSRTASQWWIARCKDI